MHLTALSFLVVLAAAPLPAGVALLVAEPFGSFGAFNPTGHAAIYLSGVCAETPVKLRPCRTGEEGVVISRYNKIGGYDWIAVPLLAYLYAVARPEDVPEAADAETVAALRDRYRRAHLRAVAPDAPGGGSPQGHWIQMVGAAYDRQIYGFILETAPEDDERLMEHLNGRDNVSRFDIFRRNCADFARGIVNFYYPKALRRSIVADFGISTPKQSAKSMVAYSRKRPDLQLTQFVIPQAGGVRRSGNVRGVNESLIRSKKYVVPLVLLQPWVAAASAVAYLTRGRFNPRRHCHAVCEPGALDACMAGGDGSECAPVAAAHGPPT